MKVENLARGLEQHIYETADSRVILLLIVSNITWIKSETSYRTLNEKVGIVFERSK